MKINERKRLILLYHFFHPDDVISARLFTELGEQAAAEGWEVVAMPSVRSCHDGEARLLKRESWRGIDIRRVWRPAWRQASNKGRLGNTAAMLLNWTWRSLWTERTQHETVIIGTDPPLGVLAAIPWRIFRPRTRIIHWCHDVYPQAAIADGVLKPTSMLVTGLNALLRVAYRRCDVIADLGPCMRELLREASGEKRDPSPPAPLPRVLGRGEPLSADDNSRVLGRGETLRDDDNRVLGREEPRGDDDNRVLEETEGQGPTAFSLQPKHLTLTPWSLVEPVVMPTADERVRKELFGECKLGLLYSGNLGRAHVYDPFVKLAQQLAGDSIGFCYAGRGPRMEELREQLQVASNERKADAPLSRVLGPGESESNIRLAGFADEKELTARLAAADVHMVSLHPSWTGTVVPSKFFGALAVGRPILFAGRGDSAIAIWLRQYGVGWVLEDDASINDVAEQLRQIANDRQRLRQLQQRCFEIYHEQFSKARQMKAWMIALEAGS